MNRYWLLGASLAPLLGATGTAHQALLIALCALLLLTLHQALMAPLRRHLEPDARQWASLALVAALVTCLQLGLRAWALPVAQLLGHYPMLLALPCLAIDRQLPETGRWRALSDQLCILLPSLLALGACRQLLGETFGLHLASLAPGGLIVLGLLLGLYNHLRPSRPSSRRQGNL
ncbi:Rnf-Nqr domain containing protein [Pantoea sp. Cy-639]|uniref:Rnf-Nqr domain containing protein n=1 Tax=Pantoea sp. Cy-639 TaxID=2608360 RepID=UPI0014206253|nr:Rnf-Nqr domain containing protein [Pantoea sp. Cy-639]NIF19468.1 NADH:quinone oxidoreductase [Pantoea sp. Cy-639]